MKKKKNQLTNQTKFSLKNRMNNSIPGTTLKFGSLSYLYLDDLLKMTYVFYSLFLRRRHTLI